MAIVIINKELENAIDKKFKGESVKVFSLLHSLEENPHKGKSVGNIGGILIKELKYNKFRFYFILEGDKLKIFSKEELTNLLIKFVRMSDKNNQQKVIDEIKDFLRNIDKKIG
ncbi:MAG: hypothetical protein Q8Q42_02520 [Nanoarchaeota archaeon]|nr:hypothetical protein [Nanoarchaeota archaeon]